MMVGGNSTPSEIENLMDVEMETHQEAHTPPTWSPRGAMCRPSVSWGEVGDAVNVMGLAGQPPAVLR